MALIWPIRAPSWPSSWPTFVLAQHDFDVDPNMAHPSWLWCLPHHGPDIGHSGPYHDLHLWTPIWPLSWSKMAAQSHLDLRLDLIWLWYRPQHDPDIGQCGPQSGLYLERPSSWPNIILISVLICPFQFDFDIGPNIALILANIDLSWPLSCSKMIAQNYIDLRLGPI